jgi:hypothetical protein
MIRTYYRLSDDEPRFGELVHCFTSLEVFRRDVRNMRQSGVPADEPGAEMKFWEVQGEFVRPDGDDAVVRVVKARQIRI